MKILYTYAAMYESRIAHCTIVRRGKHYLASLSVTYPAMGRTYLTDRKFYLPDDSEDEAVDFILTEVTIFVDDFIDECDEAEEGLPPFGAEHEASALAEPKTLFPMRGNGARN